MIVTKNELRKALAGVEQGIDHIHKRIDDAQVNIDVAMSAAASVKRGMEQVSRTASEAMMLAADEAGGAVRAIAQVDVIVPAVAENITSIQRIERRLSDDIQRIDNVFSMLMEYLDVEIVYQPARQYVDKKRKSRR